MECLNLIDAFSSEIIADYAKHREETKEAANLQNFAVYLVNRGLIPDRSVELFCIQKDMDRRCPKPTDNKTEAVRELSDKYGKDERNIWNDLRATNRAKFTYFDRRKE